MKKLSLLLLSFASAQINYSGEINPSVMTRKSNQSQINLPFRIATLEGGYTSVSYTHLTLPTILLV